MRPTVFAVIVAFVTLSASTAASADLRPGDPAPRLSITDWVRREAVDLEAVRGKKVVVVEFWATWCGPCVVSIPHLTELQKKHADDVVIVGVTKPDPRNSHDAVKAFVEKKGDTMDYTVAFDGDGTTYADYMTAAGQRGIPTAFIVDKEGAVAWIGHPSSMDAALERVVRGEHDVELEGVKFTLRRRWQKQYGAGDLDGAARTLQAISLLDSDDASALYTLFVIRTRQGRSEAAAEVAVKLVDHPSTEGSLLSALVRGLLAAHGLAEAPKLALRAARKAVEKSAESSSARFALLRALVANGALDEARAAGKSAVRLAQDSAPDLNSIAWTLLTDDAIGERFDDLAREAADRLYEISPERWSYIDTVALARFRTDDAEGAVRLQSLAIEKARAAGLPGPRLAELEKRLAQYRGEDPEKSAEDSGDEATEVPSADSE